MRQRKNNGVPVYVVTLRRTDMTEPDPVNIVAHSAADARADALACYPGRVLAVLSVRKAAA